MASQVQRLQVAALGLFLLLVGLVKSGILLDLDSRSLLDIHAHSSASLDEFMLNLNAIAGPKPVYGATFLIAAYLAYSKRWKAAAFVTISMATTGLLNLGLRDFFHRHRPELWRTLIYDHSFVWSFPSGHSCLAASLATVIVILLWKTPYRVVAVAGGALYCVAVASTTLFLGVHFPTDIAAGWLTGWLTITLIFSARKFLART
jgi:undecaprenyl-diphosphatase